MFYSLLNLADDKHLEKRIQPETSSGRSGQFPFMFGSFLQNRI
jgi:hypothetical protein